MARCQIENSRHNQPWGCGGSVDTGCGVLPFTELLEDPPHSALASGQAIIANYLSRLRPAELPDKIHLSMAFSNSPLFAELFFAVAGASFLIAAIKSVRFSLYERREYARMADQARLKRLSGVAADAVWFVRGVPSIWQRNYRLASRFRPGVVSLDGTSLRLCDRTDHEVFRCDVAGKRIIYGQAGGDFRVEAKDEQYVISFAPSQLNPPLVTRAGERWARRLAGAGANVIKRAVILRYSPRPAPTP